VTANERRRPAGRHGGARSTAEFSEPEPLRAVTYRNIPILDLTAPTIAQ